MILYHLSSSLIFLFFQNLIASITKFVFIYFKTSKKEDICVEKLIFVSLFKSKQISNNLEYNYLLWLHFNYIVLQIFFDNLFGYWFILLYIGIIFVIIRQPFCFILILLQAIQVNYSANSFPNDNTYFAYIFLIKNSSVFDQQ